MRHSTTDLTSAHYDSVRKMTYIALDYPSWAEAKCVVDQLGQGVDGYKVGLQLFHADGAVALPALRELGKRVFLDVKLHDIPNTVAGALGAICASPIEMVNIHASGGRKMMEAARAAVDRAPYKPLLIGVTALTSLADEDLQDLALPSSLEWVDRLARLAMDCGLDGVVASALDIRAIRAWSHPSFEIVVPGTRPAGTHLHDQARSATPSVAVHSGATRLVLGRAVTQAEHPVLAVEKIWEEMLQGSLQNDLGGVVDGTSISR